MVENEKTHAFNEIHKCKEESSIFRDENWLRKHFVYILRADFMFQISGVRQQERLD